MSYEGSRVPACVWRDGCRGPAVCAEKGFCDGPPLHPDSQRTVNGSIFRDSETALRVSDGRIEMNVISDDALADAIVHWSVANGNEYQRAIHRRTVCALKELQSKRAAKRQDVSSFQLLPIEREELIKHHSRWAVGCLMQDDFNGQAQHEQRAELLRSMRSGDVTVSNTKPDPKKGELNGECERRACSNRPATWQHRDSKLFYCKPCGMLINDSNPDCDPPLMGPAATSEEIGARR